jgi:hypothetical protein
MSSERRHSSNGGKCLPDTLVHPDPHFCGRNFLQRRPRLGPSAGPRQTVDRALARFSDVHRRRLQATRSQRFFSS